MGKKCSTNFKKFHFCEVVSDICLRNCHVWFCFKLRSDKNRGINKNVIFNPNSLVNFHFMFRLTQGIIKANIA